MLAILRTGGKQYIVEKGTTLEIEKIEGDEGTTATFTDILMASNDKKTVVGTPVVEKAKITATIDKQFKGEKVLIQKFKAKTGYRRRKGHRQNLTQITITDISL